MIGVSRRSLGLLLGLLAVAPACPEEPPPEDTTPRRLADADGWERVVDPAEDVFAAMRPADAVCDDAGYFVDPLSLAFEVDTGLCDYLTVRQPSREALAPGDLVSVNVVHYELSAPEPGEAYVALAIDGVIAWEGAPIPSAPGMLSGEITIDRALPAGVELQLHVHNHGPNSYELTSVMLTPGGAE